MDIELVRGAYKSLERPFRWTDIPKFAVLTGKNGSGKSQLLELIHATLGHGGPKVEAELQVVGVDYAPHEVVLVRSEWAFANVGAVGVGNVQNEIQQLVQQLRRPRQEKDLLRRARLTRVIDAVEESSGKKIADLSDDEIRELIPRDADLIDYVQTAQLPIQLSNLCYRYFVEESDRRLRTEASIDEVREEMGPPPWKVINEFLKASSIKYQVTTPVGLSLKETFQLELVDQERNAQIAFASLSSGERAVVSTIMWLYAAREHGLLPKLVLLDEPDAHLHPSMTAGFLRGIRETLVDHHGARVIMTTHRPTTVAVVPEEAVYEMHRDPERIRKAESANRSIALLSSNIFSVLRGVRAVLVEDHADVRFYNTLKEALLRTRDVDADVVPVFIPASTGTGKNKVGGGVGAVKDWVGKLRASKLDGIVQGLTDGDGKNQAGNGIHVLPRYSIENYLVDPIVVCAALMADRVEPEMLKGEGIGFGDEHKFRELPDESLQRIAETVLAELEKTLDDLKPEEKELEDVEFCSGSKLRYPAWILQRRGKDLVSRTRAAWGNGITEKSLAVAFERVRLVPTELRDLITAIVGDASDAEGSGVDVD